MSPPHMPLGRAGVTGLRSPSKPWSSQPNMPLLDGPLPPSLMSPMWCPARRDTALPAWPCPATGPKPPEEEFCLLLRPRVVRELLHKLLLMPRTNTLDAMRCRLRTCTAQHRRYIRIGKAGVGV